MARPATLRHYLVDADRVTGDWLTTPEYVGEVDMDTHLATPDTEAQHHDTAEIRNGCLPETVVTVAVTITWRD